VITGMAMIGLVIALTGVVRRRVPADATDLAYAD
jgi:hypothetical protein